MWHLKVDWADLVTLDLSQFEKPGGKPRLAKQLQEAIQKIGKWYSCLCLSTSVKIVW